MLGAIIGDIVGKHCKTRQIIETNFSSLLKKDALTDNTICTIAIADAINNSSDDYRSYIRKWCRKYQKPFVGYTSRFWQWIMSDETNPYDSDGNGAALRISPIAFAFKETDKVIEEAQKCAICTHNHPEGIKGAQTVALAIRLALNYNEYSYQSAVYHIDEIIQNCIIFSGYDINIPKSVVITHPGEACQKTIPVAIKIISMAKSYEDALRMALELSAVSTSLCTIVGSIAEAIGGIRSYLSNPIVLDYTNDKGDWEDPVFTEEMESVYDEFFKWGVRSNKMLEDTTFDGYSFNSVAWDMLYDIEGEKEVKRMHNMVERRKLEKIILMEERAKARKEWI